MGIFSLALCQGAGVTPLFGTPRPVAVTHLPQRSPETFEETPRDLEGTKPWEKSLYHLFVFNFFFEKKSTKRRKIAKRSRYKSHAKNIPLDFSNRKPASFREPLSIKCGLDLLRKIRSHLESQDLVSNDGAQFP